MANIRDAQPRYGSGVFGSSVLPSPRIVESAPAKVQEGTRLADGIPGRLNPDGSYTFTPGTKVTLRLGFRKAGAAKPGDYAYRTVGEMFLPVTATLRRVDTAFDLKKAEITKTYKVEPHPGDSAQTKERFLQMLKNATGSMFKGLPNAPVRAIRLDMVTPGYKEVSRGKDRVLPVIKPVARADTNQGVRQPAQPDRPMPKERAVAPVRQGPMARDTHPGQRPPDRGYVPFGQRRDASRDVPAPQRPPARAGAHVWDNLSRTPTRAPVAAPARPVQPRPSFDARPSIAPIAPAAKTIETDTSGRPLVDFSTNPRLLERLGYSGLYLRKGTEVDLRIGHKTKGVTTYDFIKGVILVEGVEVDGSENSGRFINFSLSSSSINRIIQNSRLLWEATGKITDVRRGLAQQVMVDYEYLLPALVDFDSITNVQFYPAEVKK
jgi:hypothetical protein